MKRIMYIITIIILAILWVWGFAGTGTFGKICVTALLGTPTVMVVRAFLISLSNEKDEKRQKEAYERRMESEANNTPAIDQNSCFCTNCGAKNEKTASFCVGCGQPIDKS